MIKLFSAFSGIGAFEKALENLNIDFEITGFSEIDKYSCKSYCILHNIDKSFNYGDITKIDVNTLPDFDLFTWGFPCQDLSVIGKQKGFNGEKSVLFFYGYEILKHKKPAVSIIENVSNLLSKRFNKELNTIVNLLGKLGYKTKILRMNAKEYGIPQNRDRVFIVSMLDKYPHLNIKKTEQICHSMLKIFWKKMLIKNII
ncbi:DNA (cytosine-5-)-methyltransferase [uncultured Brachyspira sp.]|uniref:DNA (cytosine-5-)-methyltransferase n=1 Tax=uncultured Brachyspira sp. TaxID=221953 RepID=UPI0026192DF2|nr:DNA (cytosine-5-)-methyltransferase [uncultured Brachyspira sp.]